MAALTIISNRLPISVKKTDGKLEFFPSIGGLATGLSGYTKDPRNKWIGWPGIASDDLTEKDKKTIATRLKRSNCYPVFLSQAQLEDFYNGYCNSVIWPLFHNLPPEKEREEWWKAYEAVNDIFVGAAQHYAPRSRTIWVHDYQLLLAPRLLRRAYPTAKIGFFLHIPFPDADHFKKLEKGRALLRGVLGADLAGFHTKSYGSHFLECLEAAEVGKISENAVVNGRRTTQIADFPMGIDYKRFTKLSSSNTVQKNVLKFRRKYGNRRIIFTNDRLDPTKGLPHKIRAFGKLLELRPELRGKVVMAMLVAPSRTDIKAYKELKAEIEELIDNINKTYGRKGYTPIDYMFRTMNFNEISAMYQLADIAFVTPVRDGMNLVAKEYIASKPDRKGVLILSETAGAAEELEHALLVNPRHHNSLVSALYKALSMPDVELKERIGSMQKHLSRHTVHNWAKKFVNTLSNPASIPSLPSRLPSLPVTNKVLTKRLGKVAEEKLVSKFKTADKKLLVFDHDGVLTPIVSSPEKAKPTKAVKKLLKELSNKPGCEVMIISGRSQADLENWFGDLPVSLAAEHGAFVRRGNESVWRDAALLSSAWKPKVVEIMERMVARTPGSFVEQKTNAIVWHYRQSPRRLGQANSLILKQSLRAQLVNTALGVYTGKMIIEVKSKLINKGSTLKEACRSRQDFVLVMGDDYTDEHMFRDAPASAYTIKVGDGLTRARWRLDSTESVLELLKKLAS